MSIQLPNGWVITNLENVVNNRKGKKPKILNSEYFKDSVPYLDIKAFEKNEIRQYADKKSSYLVDENCVVIVWDGARSGWSAKGKLGALGSTLAAVSPILGEVDYLYYYLQSQYEYINKNPRGIGIPHVDPSKFWVLPFPLAPLAEQKRIAGKLDTLFGHLDKVNAGLERIPELLKKFRQQVLTQAVTGKLTEDWRKGKSFIQSNKILKEIINERKKIYDLQCLKAKENGSRKPTKVFLDKLPQIEEIKIDIPASWFQSNVHFFAFVTKLAGFEYTKYFDLKSEGEIPVVRAQNVQMGRFDDKNRLYMSEEVSNILERSQLHGREILMVFIGAGTGNVCMAPTGERWHLAPNVAKIDTNGIDARYLYYYLQSPLGLENTLSRVKATAQPSLSMETIRDIVVISPPVEEQKEIVRRIDGLFAFADTIERQYHTLQEKAAKLPQAILSKAFRGELVPQDPNDEHATELLKRIKAMKNKN